MKKVFMISVLALLLVSCSANKNVNIEKSDLKTRFNRKNETVDNISKYIVEHTYITRDYTEIDEYESNAVEDHSSSLEITKQNETLINSPDKNSELVYDNKQQIVPPNKQEEFNNNQIEVNTSPPITTPPPIETTPTPVEEPKELSPEPLCPNAWYDDNQPCDWIHPNLKPTDEFGRTVPTFPTSENAWNWAEKQLFDETSTWYMCGFNIMDGHTNDGTAFFYGYMKACP